MRAYLEVEQVRTRQVLRKEVLLALRLNIDFHLGAFPLERRHGTGIRFTAHQSALLGGGLLDDG